MLRVQLPMQLLEPMKETNVSRTSPLASRLPFRRRDVGMHRKCEELSLRGATERSRHAWIEKSNDSLQHTIGRESVASVYAENAPAQAEHHRLVRVSKDSFDLPETEGLQPRGKTVLEQEALPRRRAAPPPHLRPRFPASPLPRLHSP